MVIEKQLGFFKIPVINELRHNRVGVQDLVIPAVFRRFFVYE
tara:strand:- start:314 stop:439 length:126 start_codon:yes stop_codon:yes gene_type:complete